MFMITLLVMFAFIISIYAKLNKKILKLNSTKSSNKNNDNIYKIPNTNLNLKTSSIECLTNDYDDNRNNYVNRNYNRNYNNNEAEQNTLLDVKNKCDKKDKRYKSNNNFALVDNILNKKLVDGNSYYYCNFKNRPKDQFYWINEKHFE